MWKWRQTQHGWSTLHPTLDYGDCEYVPLLMSSFTDPALEVNFLPAAAGPR